MITRASNIRKREATTSVFLAILAMSVSCSKPRETEWTTLTSYSESTESNRSIQTEASQETRRAPSSTPTAYEQPFDRTKRCGPLRDLSAKEREDGTLEVSRAALRQAVDDFVEWKKLGYKIGRSPFPTKTRGGETGFIVFEIAPGATCGLARGDILLRVNGFPLGDFRWWSEIDAQLRSATRLEVEIERYAERPEEPRVPKTLVYHLQD